MANALIVLAEGFEDIEAVTTIDVLRRGGVEVTIASLASSPDVTSAHQLALKADTTFAAAAEATYDVIVLPGGPGTQLLAESEALLARLNRQKEDGRLIAAICAAPTVLEKAGVLEADQHVTCYPTCCNQMNRECADVPVVTDGLIVTGQAPGASLLFALVVLQTLLGERAAQRVAEGLVTDVY